MTVAIVVAGAQIVKRSRVDDVNERLVVRRGLVRFAEVQRDPSFRYESSENRHNFRISSLETFRDPSFR